MFNQWLLVKFGKDLGLGGHNRYRQPDRRQTAEQGACRGRKRPNDRVVGAGRN